MSPIDRISINDKLFRLQETTRVIGEIVAESAGGPVKDERSKSALYFNLIVSIEIILDIGNHILAESFNTPANSYKDIILGLGEKGVVPKEFSVKNRDMGDFRNKIVHDYDQIDDRKAIAYAREAPAIFKEFMKYFMDFAERK